MNWLKKLDEIATQYLPEEDRRENDQDDREENNDLMMIDPLLDDFSYRNEGTNEEIENKGSQSQSFDTSVEPPSASKTPKGRLSASGAAEQSEGNASQTKSLPAPIEPESSILLQQPDTDQHQSTGDATAEHQDSSSSFYTPGKQHGQTPTASRNNDTPGRDLPPSQLEAVLTTPSSRTIQVVDTPIFSTPDSTNETLGSSEDCDKYDLGTMPTNSISVSAQDDVTDDFEVDMPIQDWNGNMQPLDTSKNCLGVVHVRVLAADNLPCPIGSPVHLAVSLLPWKGRVRGEASAVAFAGNDSVRVRWDHLEESGCSLVHSWNNEDTPIPTMNLELIMKPIQLLEFNMCSLELSCQPIMSQPGVWKRQWCEAKVNQTLQEKHTAAPHGNSVFMLVEAAFFPATDDQDEDDTAAMTEERRTSTLDGATSESVTRRSRGGDGSTSVSTRILKNSKPHYLKVQSIWKPAFCALCKKSLLGWNRAYHCEVCKIDCCEACQVQIDLQIPCGSTIAKNAVGRSIQNKLTLGNMLTTIAPVDEKYEEKVKVSKAEKETKGSKRRSTKFDMEDEDQQLAINKDHDASHRMGRFCVQVHRAYVFEKALPMETDPKAVFETEQKDRLKHGDYYVRVSRKGEADSQRTKTVQSTGRPQFDSHEMLFDVPDYGVEYRVDVIDASNNKTVGTTVLPTQYMLQLQRDELIQESGVNAFFPQLKKQRRKATPTQMRLELRTGFKSPSAYFATGKPKKTKKDDAKPGSISGWVLLDFTFDEEIEKLYSQNPIECPDRSPDDLDTDKFSVHIGRISAIVADISKGVSAYLYLVSWQDPVLTLTSAIVFVWLCVRFDAEYIGCLPVFGVIATMGYLAILRANGHIKDRFINRERESRVKSELEATVDYPVHRPVGALDVRVEMGRSLRSRELGLTGSVGCRILWDPLRYQQDAKKKKELVALDKTLKAYHELGESGFQYTANPTWEAITASDELRRLRRYIPDSEAFVGNSESPEEQKVEAELSFPLLQPIQKIKEDGVAKIVTAPWSELSGAIVFQVRFKDIVNRFGFDEVLGEVAIPVSRLASKKEVKGWFQVMEEGTTYAIRCDENSEGDTPHIYIQLSWNFTESQDASDTEREASIALAEEMIRFAAKNAEAKTDILGTTFGAFNTVRGLSSNIQTIQNTLGNIADLLETVRNIFNFTDPHVSSLVLCVLFILWLFLAVIPTRALVFVAGVGQYVATFMAKYSKPSVPKKSDEDASVGKPVSESKTSPVVVWLTNVFRSIPTDEDLRKAYHWESRRISEREVSKLALKKRISRLRSLWKAKWHSTVRVKVTNERRTVSREKQDWHWEDGFAVVHGRQLLMWETETDFDEGDEPSSRVVFAGHAGLAGLSPLEMRELSKDEISRVANIFGRGDNGQLKLMLLMPEMALKDSFEEAIMEASLKSD